MYITFYITIIINQNIGKYKYQDGNTCMDMSDGNTTVSKEPHSARFFGTCITVHY